MVMAGRKVPEKGIDRVWLRDADSWNGEIGKGVWGEVDVAGVAGGGGGGGADAEGLVT